MTKNPILDELHAVRQQLLAGAGGTLDALIDRLHAEEQQSDRPQFKSPLAKQRIATAEAGELEAKGLLPTPGDL